MSSHQPPALRVPPILNRSRAQRDHLFANVSHELRTPLSGILASVELLLDGGLPSGPEQSVRIIEHCARRLTRLIDDFLDLTADDEVIAEADELAFCPRHLISAACDRLKSQRQAKGLALRVTNHSELPPLLVGQVGILSKILVHLLDNAVKFTSSGWVGVHTEVVDRAADRLTLRISVLDTGIGIPSAYHRDIFAAFTQVDASSTRPHGGAGLGLAICQRLAAAMGGHIDLDSAPGEGSSFALTSSFGWPEGG